MSSVVAGYLSAIAGAVVSGSWQAMIKLEPTGDQKLHPATILCLFILGFFVASWVACIVEYEETYSFTAWGLVSGALFVVSMALNIVVSFPVLGIAVGSGIASSMAVLTALVWSADVFDASMRSTALTIVGVCVVVIGLNVIIFAGHKLHASKGLKEYDGKSPSESGHLLPAIGQEKQEPSRSEFLLAVTGAIFAGIFGGSYLYPSEETDKGTLFLPSMGIGSLVVAPIFGSLILLVKPATDSQPFIPSPELFVSAAPWMFAGGTVNVFAIILILKVNSIE